MQKWLIGTLSILLLFLAAANIRLSQRARTLEEELATLRKRPAPGPGSAPAAEPPPQAPLVTPPETLVAKTPDPKPLLPTTVPVPQLPPKGRNEGTPLVEAQRIQSLQLTLDSVSGKGLQFTVQPSIPEPEAGAGPRSGFLGIQGEDVPGGGVRIQSVVPDSVALRSGLRPDDVLLEYNGEPIDTLATLTSKIRSAGEGSPASLRLRRNGVEFYQGVQLGARSPAQR